MFATSHRSTRFAGRDRARALEAWRVASTLVDVRWHAYRAADPPARRAAYSAFVASLDIEEAAAAELTVASTSLAA